MPYKRDIMSTTFVKRLSSKISLGCITVWKILKKPKDFVEAKKPSVPNLGPQILVEISRGLLDKPREFAVKFGPGLGP